MKKHKLLLLTIMDYTKLLVNFLENVFSIPSEIISKANVYIGNTYEYKGMQRKLILTKAPDIWNHECRNT